MSIKLIATDLDGTLMSTDHMTITDFTLNTLRLAHDKGVKIAIATGRPIALTQSVIEQIPFVDYVIYANGACVSDLNKGKLIYADLIPNDKAVDIISYFLTQKVFFEVYIDGRSHYQLGQDKYFKTTDFPDDFVTEVRKSMDGHESLLDFLGDRGIEKITLYCLEECDYPVYEAKFGEFDFSVAISFKGSLEATNITADKGNALKGLSEILGITSDEVMSFGDAGNDIPMLSFAKYSFAMANGTDECKASARFIAKSNADDGLAKAVVEYVLNK